MKVDDMVVVDFEEIIIEGLLRPSSDKPTHHRLFQTFTGIRSVVHTHSRNTVAFAQAEMGIPRPGTTRADYFLEPLPYRISKPIGMTAKPTHSPSPRYKPTRSKGCKPTTTLLC